MNQELVIRGNKNAVRGYTRALIDTYGKDETLENVIKDLKQKRLNRQISFMESNYGI